MQERTKEFVFYLMSEGFEFQVTKDTILWTNPFDEPHNNDKDDYIDVTSMLSLHVGESKDLIDILCDYVEKNYRQCDSCDVYLFTSDVYSSNDEYGRDDHQDGICYECLGDIAEANTDPYTLRGLRRSDF